MKPRSFALLIAIASVLASCISQTPAAPAPPAKKPLAELLDDWRLQKQGMIQIAEAMPAEKFSFKPTPKQRTFGEQILHVATSNVDVFKLMGNAKAPSFPTTAAESKALAIQALADSYDFGTAVLQQQTDSTIEQLVNTSFAGPCSKARLAWNMLGHSQDIYGQMVVYLRLNNIVPPASRI